MIMIDTSMIQDKIDEADYILEQVRTVLDFAQVRLAADTPIGDELPFAVGIMTLLSRSVEAARSELDIAAEYAHKRP